MIPRKMCTSFHSLYRFYNQIHIINIYLQLHHHSNQSQEQCNIEYKLKEKQNSSCYCKHYSDQYLHRYSQRNQSHNSSIFQQPGYHTCKQDRQQCRCGLLNTQYFRNLCSLFQSMNMKHNPNINYTISHLSYSNSHMDMFLCKILYTRNRQSQQYIQCIIKEKNHYRHHILMHTFHNCQQLNQHNSHWGRNKHKYGLMYSSKESQSDRMINSKWSYSKLSIQCKACKDMWNYLHNRLCLHMLSYKLSLQYLIYSKLYLDKVHKLYNDQVLKQYKQCIQVCSWRRYYHRHRHKCQQDKKLQIHIMKCRDLNIYCFRMINNKQN